MVNVQSREPLVKSGPLDNRKNIVEFNILSNEQKWRYLKAYWDKASEFYGLKQELIIPDGELHAQISKLKTKPSSKIRRVIALKDWRWKLDAEMDEVREGYFKHDYADESWEKTKLPHNVNYTPPDPVEFGTVDAPWYNSRLSTNPRRST